MSGWLIPNAVSEAAFLVLIASSFVASFITAAFGIGGGLVLLIVMASLVPPAALIPTHGVIQLGSNIGRALIMWRHILLTALPAFSLGSMVGAALGGLLVINIPPAFVQLAIGVFVIWSVLSRPPRVVRDWPVLIGAVSSFLTMFFGASGLLVAVFTRSKGVARHTYVATHAALMIVQHGLKTLVFGFLGFAFAEYWGLIAAMISTGLAGTVIGGQMLSRIDERRFSTVLNVLLIMLSLRLIYAGATALMRGA